MDNWGKAMESILSAKHFQDEEAAYAFHGIETLAARRCVRPLRRDGAHQQDAGQVHPHRRVQVLRLPQTVSRHRRHNHLQRYVTEFDFRYNYRKANGWTDEQRAEQLLRGVIGKRLTYETTSSGMRVA